MFPDLPPPFLHTASNQKLDSGKAWERGYKIHISSDRAYPAPSKYHIHKHLGIGECMKATHLVLGA